MQYFLARAYARQYVIHTVCHSWGLLSTVTLRASSETRKSLWEEKKDEPNRHGNLISKCKIIERDGTEKFQWLKRNQNHTMQAVGSRSKDSRRMSSFRNSEIQF